MSASSVPDGLLETVRAIHWAANGADPAVVLAAFEGLSRVRNEPDATAAYHTMLNAIAHDHSGWLYDSAAPAAPILVNYVRDSEGWQRQASIDILIECLSWARHDQEFLDADGVRKSVKEAIAASVTEVRGELELLAADRNHTSIASAARELLEILSAAT